MNTTTETPQPRYMNRGGEVWERTETGERELFAADIIKRIADLERERDEARESLALVKAKRDALAALLDESRAQLATTTAERDKRAPIHRLTHPIDYPPTP